MDRTMSVPKSVLHYELDPSSMTLLFYYLNLLTCCEIKHSLILLTINHLLPKLYLFQLCQFCFET